LWQKIDLDCKTSYLQVQNLQLVIYIDILAGMYAVERLNFTLESSVCKQVMLNGFEPKVCNRNWHQDIHLLIHLFQKITDPTVNVVVMTAPMGWAKDELHWFALSQPSLDPIITNLEIQELLNQFTKLHFDVDKKAGIYCLHKLVFHPCIKTEYEKQFQKHIDDFMQGCRDDPTGKLRYNHPGGDVEEIERINKWGQCVMTAYRFNLFA
jgi:hypothetical protein